MNDCLSAEMRDVLPEVVHGRLDAAKLAEVEAHVASCDACASELELLRAVVASMPVAPAMDVQRIVAALPVAAKQGLLLHRGNGEPASASDTPIGRPQSVWSSPLLRVAAAVVVVAAGGLSLLVGRDVLNPEAQVGGNNNRIAVTSRPVAPPSSATTVAPSAPVVVESPPAGVPVAGTGAGLLMSEVDGLSDEHLVALLSEMDSIDALPDVEPETIVPAVVDSDSGAGE
ncbi:MAG TPA: zf-HC2 domain-containing protein [Gemmatimonadaceae bacterium]|nr:zf-HC2 domain-containing protein [Gemmatimonadaceae bacterium]